MINNYNIYEKINMLLNKFDLDLKINIQNDDFFKELFDKFIKNKINLNNNKKNINMENISLNINNSENIINKNNDGNMNTIIEKKYCLVKLLYKKLVVIFHPDKGGNQEIFIKIKDYYDMDLLIGLLSIYYNNNLVLPELTQKDNDKILNEIIKLYIYLLQNNIL